MSVASASDLSNVKAHQNEEQEVYQKLLEVREINKQIYEEKIKDMNVVLDSKMKQFNASSLEELNAQERASLASLEHKLWLEAIETVDKNMEEHGWTLVENTDRKDSLMSTPGNLEITDRLYTYTNKDYFTFEGYWNWTNGTWDPFKNTLDIAAFRALNKVDSIINSSISAWDSGGNSRNSYVNKRTETDQGVIFNVDDHYIKIPGGPAVMYTDNGQISVFGTSAGYNKFFLTYEHNWKDFEGGANATIDTTKLTNSRLIVTYNTTTKTWQQESYGRTYN